MSKKGAGCGLGIVTLAYLALRVFPRMASAYKSQYNVDIIEVFLSWLPSFSDILLVLFACLAIPVVLFAIVVIAYWLRDEHTKNWELARFHEENLARWKEHLRELDELEKLEPLSEYDHERKQEYEKWILSEEQLLAEAQQRLQEPKQRINKFLNMLESPKANVRFEACEELRVAKFISADAITALENALNDPDSNVRSSAASALAVHKPSSTQALSIASKATSIQTSTIPSSSPDDEPNAQNTAAQDQKPMPQQRIIAKSKNIRRRNFGCLAGIAVLVVVCVALIAIPEISQIRVSNAGIRAFSQGDCKEAVRKFDTVLNGFNWGIVNVRSQVEPLRLECMAFLEAVAEEDAQNYGLALARYIDFPTIYPNSSLKLHLPSRVAALLGKASAEELGIKETCDKLALLRETRLVPRPEDQLPELYYYCGKTYEGNGDLENAIIMYNTVRTDYPTHHLAANATDGLARAEIELSQRVGTRKLAQPERSGEAPHGTSVYIVQNDSPEIIELVLSGPDTVIDEIPACRGCDYYWIEPLFCPGKGPLRRYTLKPGTYDVLVKSVSDNTVTPYHGTWIFRSGAEYSDCFFIITKFRP